MAAEFEPGSEGRRPTVYDVARAAGVSHSSVSRVVRGGPGMTPATRARILAVIAEMGYVPNRFARALATTAAPQLGAVVVGDERSSLRLMLSGVARVARREGLLLRVRRADRDADASHASIELAAEGVRGLVILTESGSGMAGEAVPRLELPMSVVAPAEAACATVRFPAEAAWSALADHVAHLGHRRIRLVGGRASSAAAVDRVPESVLARGDLRARQVSGGDLTSDFGYYLGSHPHLLQGATAVLAASDSVALGIIHGLVSRGQTVPGDVSVAGIGDEADARHFHPPLTSARIDYEAAGAAGASQVLSALEGEQLVPQALGVSVSARASTGRIVDR